ncbi:exonuclease 3'-5' domain-containing protein 2 [Epargyreus clarus]|uniref:exonuclease 3'-5' domain-containing protein 2 n=1 Tax=Epargyreus clarus TaxID=520877 RepID=UPI003C2E0470
MGTTKLRIGLASALALGCAGLTYVIVKKKYGTRNASNILNYLKIEIVTTEDHCNAVVEEIRRRSAQHRAIGLDCEWVTEHGKRQPVALLQLSSYDGYCTLIRLCQMENFPQSLKELLEDESIYKVGVAPAGDAMYLAQDYSVFLRSTLDIRHLALLCDYEPGGLAALSLSQLNIILDKSWRIRCSNWSAEVLTDRQVNYAAADAHVAIRIFVKLINEYCGDGLLSWMYKNVKKDCWSNLDDICAKYADLLFKTKQLVKKSDLIKEKEKKEKKDVLNTSKPYPHSIRSKPLYHNCFLQAPDGALLCTCDKKKANWYVEKELADMVVEDPYTVRLRFEPAGRSVGDVGRYYQLTKENKCVVCGSGNSYIRKNIVPREYRKYFPEIMKDHSSHDVVLLCVSCHQRSNALDRAVRERLARRADAPLVASDGKYREDADCKKIRSAARALLYSSRKHVLPEQRRKDLESLLLQHYPEHDEITQELLEEAAELQVVFENVDYESHGHKVVQHYADREGLLRLEEMWREHFLDSMKPRYMPELWSLKHNEERLLVRLQEGRLSDEDRKLLGL